MFYFAFFLLVLVGSGSVWPLLEAGWGELGWFRSGGLLEMLCLNSFKSRKRREKLSSLFERSHSCLIFILAPV